jgi:hypothetical protein
LQSGSAASDCSFLLDISVQRSSRISDEPTFGEALIAWR